jgi:signal transduction histidine kinase
MQSIQLYVRSVWRIATLSVSMAIRISLFFSVWNVSCFASSAPLFPPSQAQNLDSLSTHPLTLSSTNASITWQTDAQRINNRDRQIERLSYLHELQSLEMRREELLRNALIVGVAFLLVLVFVLLNRFRLKKRITADLVKKNQDLSYANNEIVRQQRILEDQATEIELANSELQEYNLQLRKLNSEVEMRVVELETIDKIVQSINRNIEFSSLLQSLLEQGRKLFPAVEKGSVKVLDHTTNTYHFKAFFGFNPHDFDNLEQTLEEVEQEYMRYTAMDEGVYVMTEFPTTTSKGQKFAVAPPQCSLVMTIPIENVIEGMVFFDVYTSKYKFTIADRKRCQRLRQHIITAFAQARALESLQDAAERLTQQNMMLQEFNQEKNEFLGIAAHDMKNPLAQIMISAGKISRFYDRMSKEDVVRSMGYIETTTRRMSDIITNLLDINAIESKHHESSNSIINIAALVQSVSEEMRSTAAAKNIALDYNAPNDALAVNADAVSLRSIVENLCSNAIKYSPLGTTVTLRLRNSDGTVKFVVSDEGPGISEADQQRLFSKFARLSAKPTGGESSTGLGLFIVKKLVDVMNGKVWCESEQGHGATFVVELPQANNEEVLI